MHQDIEIDYIFRDECGGVTVMYLLGVLRHRSQGVTDGQDKGADLMDGEVWEPNQKANNYAGKLRQIY